MDRNSQSPGLGPRHDAASRVTKTESAADRMAALRARVNAAVGSSKAKGGLNVGLHPALEGLGSGKLDSQQTQNSLSSSQRPQPFSGNQRNNNLKRKDGQANPYLADTAAPGAGRGRQTRQLNFNQKGKYIAQAKALRRQEALEALKRRITEQTRKAGIDEDLDVEKNFVIEEPPAIEWWDEGYFEGDTYDNIENLKLQGEDSPITEYVQHPVAIVPPQDANVPAPKPMFLTPKEQAKIRRQRRMADRKENQAKISLGLIPAPPPKVKKGNLMRVLGDAAVKDPTAVEARVNREIAERYETHMNTNEERKLTKDQRHEKLQENQQKDADKGIYLLVFKINTLANGQHRFKIGINAEELALTGTCILNPKFNLVIVEGGEWSITKYKKLMLNRIDWTENAPSRVREEKKANAKDWLVAEDENGNLKDISINKCTLVFEGEQKVRSFRKWGSRVCESDSDAREALARSRMDSFWSMAKAMP